MNWLGDQGCLEGAQAEVAEPEIELFDKPSSILRLDQNSFNNATNNDDVFPFDVKPSLFDEISIADQKSIEVPIIFEVWAWYQPIHFYGECWGIYVKEEAIKEIAIRIYAVADEFYKGDPRRLINESIFASYQILYLHEIYHHKVESFAIRNHIVLTKCTFASYFENVYKPARSTNPTSCKEEALCHAFSKRQLPAKLRGKVDSETLSAAMSVLQEILDSAVGPYAGATSYLAESDFINAQSYLQSQIQEATVKPTRKDASWRHDTKLFAPLFSGVSIPCFIIPQNDPQIFLPGVYEFSAPRKGILRVLNKNGYLETSGGKGSHTKYTKPGSPMIIIPKGNEVSATVLKSVAHSLGTDLQELVSQARQA